MSDDVLTCPFCGCMPEIYRNTKTRLPIDCGCININCPASGMDTVPIEVWNKRATPPLPVGDREEGK